MSQAKSGDTVKVFYTGTLDDGTVFDSNVGGDALEFTLGEGQLIQGFENAVIGMAPGDSTVAKIPADDAYGPHLEERKVIVSRAELPDGLAPRVGQRLKIQTPEGAIVVQVTDAADETVTLDGNHPLAGKDLTFEIELVEIA